MDVDMGHGPPASAQNEAAAPPVPTVKNVEPVRKTGATTSWNEEMDKEDMHQEIIALRGKVCVLEEAGGNLQAALRAAQKEISALKEDASVNRENTRAWKEKYDTAARLLEKHGVVAAPATLSRLLCRHGFTYKKTADGRGMRTRRHS